MKKRFLTGLAILLPIVLTIMIVIFMVNLFTRPFHGLIDEALTHLDRLESPFWFFTAREVLHFVSRLLALLLLFALITAVGLLARILFVRYFIRFADALMHRIPVINKIYKASQDVVRTVFDSETKAFTQVVLAPFPHEKTYSIGLITNEALEETGDQQFNLISVFIPATPNPTVGYMLLFRKEQLIFIDMKVEEALKVIVSCGVMITDFAKRAS